MARKKNNMATKLEKFQEIEELVRKISKEEAEKVYGSNGTQFGVPQVPIHIGDGVDTSRTPIASIDGIITVNRTSQNNATGYASPAVLGNQTFISTTPAVQTISFPINIIRGFGVGGDSQFNGGDAPDGTVVLFTNGLTLSTLNIRSDGQWYQFNPDSIL